MGKALRRVSRGHCFKPEMTTLDNIIEHTNNQDFKEGIRQLDAAAFSGAAPPNLNDIADYAKAEKKQAVGVNDNKFQNALPPLYQTQ